MNQPEWTKAVFLRHPFERLVSCYKDKFGRENRLYSVKMSGNKSTHILSFEEFVRLIAVPGSEHQNAHWRPQSRFCGLKKYKSKYNFIGNFEKLSSHVEVHAVRHRRSFACFVRRHRVRRFLILRTGQPFFSFFFFFFFSFSFGKVLLKGTDLWDSFGSHGWPWRDKKTGTIYYNGSMFGGNAAAHCTSCGTVSNKIGGSGGNVKGLLTFDHSKAAKTYDELLPPGSELRRLAFEYYKDDFELFASIDTPPWDNTRYKADLANKGG
jgi:hypothetical protein